MQNKLLLIIFSSVALFSCNTAYRSGQTPDDVYYSPVKYDDKTQKQEDDKPDSTAVVQNSEEREIRMKTRDRRWRDLDDNCNCNCNYTPYHYGYSSGYYYNPYYYPYPVLVGNYTTPTPVRTTNFTSYTNTPVVIRDVKTGTTRTTSYSTHNSGAGSVIREVLSPSRGSGGNRTYSPSSSSSSSGSGTRSSGTPVARPSRSN